MIEIGSKGEIEERSPAPERMPVALVFDSVSRELERVSILVSELEESLITLPQPDANTDIIVARQSVDMIQQSVDVLSVFLSHIADQCGSWDVQAESALSQVCLGSMRERLIKGTKSERI